MRLAAKDEADAYEAFHVPYDAKDAGVIGYVTSEILRTAEPNIEGWHHIASGQARMLTPYFS